MAIDDVTGEGNVYGDDVSEIYDLLYRRRGKDYRKEAEVVARLVREHAPHADSLLDVACGTGEHLRWLRESFPRVAGLELSEGMRARAEAKLPGVTVHPGDIRDFRLGRQFDAVCSLFATVGYMEGTDELDAAVASMGRHVAPGGVLIVEPWYFRDGFVDGYIGDDVVREDGRTIARVARSFRVGDTVRVQAHFVVADGAGIRTFEHTQVMSLFSRKEYATAFERAGFTATCLEETGAMLAGRCLFLGVRQDGTAR
ncbi:trans-aconitate 2-methyltransferase [Planomonospora sp. ID67723]|uniref:class I SAM-dependent methyltransferase n=1 Tax=Planomonospora sp. ID67723 TaxID=2738134 RepID=UPI0018C41D1A|nr:class I SAM-dependent methyltransferase [Planomonospora sp. ID67723]